MKLSKMGLGSKKQGLLDLIEAGLVFYQE